MKEFYSLQEIPEPKAPLFIRQAKDLVLKAEQEAAALVNAAEEQVKARFAEGYKDGYAEAKSAFLGSMLDADLQQRRIIAASKEAIMRLALRIAEEVIGEALPEHKTSIVQRTQKILNESCLQEGISIFACQDDAAYLQVLASENEGLTGEKRGIKIILDNSLPPGTAIIKNQYSSIELSPSIHFEAIGQYLKQCSELFTLEAEGQSTLEPGNIGMTALNEVQQIVSILGSEALGGL